MGSDAPEDGGVTSANVLLLIFVASALVAGAGFVGVRMWLALEDVAMTGHGYIALTLGVVFTSLVGGGLMWLVFHSNRRGYDNIDVRDE